MQNTPEHIHRFRESGTYVLLFFMGIFLLLHSIGNSGFITESYAQWEPVSSLTLAALIFGLAAYIQRRSSFAFNSGAFNQSTGKVEMLLLLLFVVGTPFFSVFTRAFDLGFEPLNLFWGALFLVLMIRLYGFKSWYLLLSLIFFVSALLKPLYDSSNLAPNFLNHNMYVAWVYGFVSGLVLILWSISDYIALKSSD